MKKEKVIKLYTDNEEWFKKYEEYSNAQIMGTYLYRALSFIDEVEQYCYKIIMKLCDNCDLDRNDVFLFLYQKEQFDYDFSDLFDEIHEDVVEADYGKKEYIESDSSFQLLRTKLDRLNEQFKKFVS